MRWGVGMGLLLLFDGLGDLALLLLALLLPLVFFFFFSLFSFASISLTAIVMLDTRHSVLIFVLIHVILPSGNAVMIASLHSTRYLLLFPYEDCLPARKTSAQCHVNVLISSRSYNSRSDE